MDRVTFLNHLRAAKHSTFNGVKRANEGVFRDQIWIDRAGAPARIRAVVEALRAHAPEKPLIRIGSDDDGGYLVPDDLEGIDACISPGVSAEVGFDLAMAERGMDVVMADASVPRPPVDHPRFIFHKKFLGVVNNDAFMRLDDLVASHPAAGDLILQMDIEGAEYGVLLDTSEETLRRFRIIVLECHDLGHMFGHYALGTIEALVAKLKRTHVVVHIHPNNCCGAVTRHDIEVPRVMEFTLLRRDRGVSAEPVEATYPHPLDVDNVSARAPLPLAKIWR